jgi:hypothetical protein
MSAMHQQRLDDYSADTPTVHYVSVVRSRASRYDSYGLWYTYSTISVESIPASVHTAVNESVDRRCTGHVLDIVFDSDGDEVLHVESESESLYGISGRYLGTGPAVPE